MLVWVFHMGEGEGKRHLPHVEHGVPLVLVRGDGANIGVPPANVEHPCIPHVHPPVCLDEGVEVPWAIGVGRLLGTM